MSNTTTRIAIVMCCLLFTACAETKRPVPIQPAVEEQVRFTGAGGATLAGTLLIPASASPAPALLLIAGSGPTDRDGNQPPTLVTDLLKQIAQQLAAQGIATLRYDKRGMYANAAEFPEDKSQWSDFFAWENFVGDAAGGYRFLLTQPRINPARIGILGHSEGGVLALQSAQTLAGENHPPKVLVLLSSPGRPMDQLLAEQLKTILGKEHATPLQVAYFVAENTRIITAIKDTGKIPDDVPPGLGALYPAYLGKFLHSEFACDPAKLATEFTGPVLLVAGSADVQVSPERDAEALDAALAHRPKDIHSLVIIPNASHNLKILPTPEDPGYTGPIVPEAMQQIATWLKKNLR